MEVQTAQLATLLLLVN